jgi:O-antigen ligase
MVETEKKNEQSKWFGAASLDEEQSRLGSAIFFLICAILVFSAAAYGAVDTWALGFLTFISGVITIFWILKAFFTREFRFNSSSLQAPLLGLITIGLIQLLPLRSSAAAGLLTFPAVNSLSLDAYSTRLFVIQLVVYLVFFAAALTFINNQKRLQKIVLTIIIFGGLMAFYGILQRLAAPEGIYGVRPTPHAMPFASFVNQHHFAAFMNMTLGLTLGFLFGKGVKKDKNLLLIIAALIMGIALLFTGSRGGFLSFLGVLGFLAAPRILEKKDESHTLETGGGKSKILLIAGVLALILVIFGAVIMLGGDQSLFRSIGLANPDDVSSGRAYFWSIALKIFLDYPILGAGLDAFGVAFTRYDTESGAYRVEEAHNDYLQILADAGILGFICVAAFVYLFFKKAASTIETAENDFRKSAARGALAGCFGILIHSFFDFPLRTPSNAFFFLVLVTIATVSIPNLKSRLNN